MIQFPVRHQWACGRRIRQKFLFMEQWYSSILTRNRSPNSWYPNAFMHARKLAAIKHNNSTQTQIYRLQYTSITLPQLSPRTALHLKSMPIMMLHKHTRHWWTHSPSHTQISPRCASIRLEPWISLVIVAQSPATSIRPLLLLFHIAHCLLSIPFIRFWDRVCGNRRCGVLREFGALVWWWVVHMWVVDRLVLAAFTKAVVDYGGVD